MGDKQWVEIEGCKEVAKELGKERVVGLVGVGDWQEKGDGTMRGTDEMEDKLLEVRGMLGGVG